MNRPNKVSGIQPTQHFVLRSRLGSSETPQRFMHYLRRLDVPELSELKHSLGQNMQLAIPYVEPFAASESDPWHRKMLYLVGGLFGLVGQPHQTTLRNRTNFGESVARLQIFQEQQVWLAPRLIQMLEGGEEQLGQHLAYLVGLLSHYQIPIDWEALLEDLFLWQREDRLVQQLWARSFHGYLVENAG